MAAFRSRFIWLRRSSKLRCLLWPAVHFDLIDPKIWRRSALKLGCTLLDLLLVAEDHLHAGYFGGQRQPRHLVLDAML